MPTSVCAVDGMRATVKMATVIWRPDVVTGESTAWKQFYCAEHYAAIGAMLKVSNSTPTECMRCGQEAIAEDAFHYLMAYVFVPGRERQDGYYQSCETCWAPLLKEVRTRSQLLPDRPAAGPTTERPPLPDPWAAWR